MTHPTTVELPESHKVRWPRFCVSCLRERPQAALKVPSVDFWGRCVPAWFQSQVFKVPCCADCRRLDFVLRWWRRLVLALCLAAAMLVCWQYGKSQALNPLGERVIFLLCCLPAFVWYAFCPRTVWICNNTRVNSFSFPNEEYATRFAAANRLGEGEQAAFEPVARRAGRLALWSVVVFLMVLGLQAAVFLVQQP